MSELLGAQRVNRSAFAVKEATTLTIYLGICPRDDRPVRFKMPADLGPAAQIPCFAGCTLPVSCERLHAVTTHLECDGSCRGARGPKPWWEHRNEYNWGPDHWGAHILADFARQLHWDKPKILSSKQVDLARRIFGEIAEQQREDAERQAARAARPGAGDQSQLVPGVYRHGADVYVVKGNKVYAAWRKDLAAAGGDLSIAPRPHDARLYAKRLVESAPRVTEAGTEIPFELVYVPGVIFDLSLADRMPLAEAEELSTRYAACIACGARLKAAKSVRGLIGPVCRKYFGPVTGEAA